MPGRFTPTPDAPWLHWGQFLLMDLFWLALVGAIVWLVVGGMRRPYRAVMPPTALEPPPSSALEILRMRYARGEIDTTTFEEMCHRILVSEQRPEQV